MSNIRKAEWRLDASNQRLFDNAKSVIKEDACMKFYDEMKPLHMKTDESEAGLGSTILKARVGTNCPRDEAHNNNILRPISFMGKSLSAVERRHRMRIIRHTTWFREVPSLLLCQGVKYNNRPKTPGGNLQKRCSYTVPEIKMHITQNSLIQSKNIL